MKIAYCLYGQPRNLEEGYKNIIKFINNHTNITFEFFYHTWHSPTGGPTYYQASPWRSLHTDSLLMDNNILDKINNLYNPKDYCYDIPKIFNIDDYINTIAYKNTNETKQRNLNNTISQLYSQTQVHNLLKSYIEKTNTVYDLVITSRFDFLNEIKIKIDSLDFSKIYICNLKNMFPDRIILSVTFLIMNINNFNKFFNIYNNLPSLLNNRSVQTTMIEFNENFEINPEELYLMNTIYEFNINKDNINNIIIFTDLIPNFIKSNL